MFKRPPALFSLAQSLNVPQGYASASHSLRPRWMAFLNILHNCGRFGPNPDHHGRDMLKTF